MNLEKKSIAKSPYNFIIIKDCNTKFPIYILMPIKLYNFINFIYYIKIKLILVSKNK